MSEVPRPKLLCVDDEESILHSLARLFKERFEVSTFTSPKAALSALDRMPDCAVVLSDYRMPEMNGLDFLRLVRDRHPLCSRAVISGQIDLQNVSDAINRADIHKFFLKPWENEYLSVQMLEALQMHRALADRAHFERLALTDPVTSVGNHRSFQDVLRRELAAAPRSLALLIFDVDHFKRYNDEFGHPRGDQLLRLIAGQLAHSAQGLGHVARYGGEEFTVVLPGLDQARALEIAESTRRFCEALAVPVTVSAGLAMYPRDATEPDLLIERADQAMYRAKAAGRNRVVISKPA